MTTGSYSTAPEPSSYGADLGTLAGVLGTVGSEVEYDRLLERAVAESPPGHSATWSLMLQLSELPFSYDNLDPAVGSLDRLAGDLAATCPGLGAMIVDDDGSVRQRPATRQRAGARTCVDAAVW